MTTRGLFPARAITARSAAGLLVIRTVSSLRPSSVIRTITLRRRCRSIPTTCRPSYASVIVGLLFPGGDGCLNNLQHPPGAEARSFIASLAFRPSQSRACPRPLARSGRRPPSSGHLRGAHGPHQLAVRVQEVPEPDQKDL